VQPSGENGEKLKGAAVGLRTMAATMGMGHGVSGGGGSALRQSGVGRFRTLPCAPDIKPDDCVEVRIVFFDAGEEMLQRLSGAHLAFANEPGDLD
jgi:hypothetical protein